MLKSSSHILRRFLFDVQDGAMAYDSFYKAEHFISAKYFASKI